MKNILYFLSKTDVDIIRRCPENTKNIHLALGFFVLMTGILAFISGTFAISTMFIHENASGRPEMASFGRFYSVIIGVIYSCFIIAIDREIVSATSRIAVIVRLPLAIVITVIVSLPVELQLFDSKLTKELREQQIKNNDSLKRTLNENNNVENIRQSINSLDARKSKAYEDVVYWTRVKQQEATGSQETGRTGKAGYGPAYYEADSNVRLNNGLIKDYDAQLAQKKEDWLSAKKMSAKEFDDTKNEQSYDLLARYIALNALKEREDVGKSVKAMSWGITLLFLLFELIPSIMKMLLPKTEYDELLNDRRRLNINAAKVIYLQAISEYRGMSTDEIQCNNPLVVQAMYNAQALD